MGTAHGREGTLTSSQGILEDLLEAQELQDGQIDGGMKAQAALVGAEGGIELHPVPSIDLQLVVVVGPDDAELNDSLGDGRNLERSPVLGVLFEEGGVLERRGELCQTTQGQWG